MTITVICVLLYNRLVRLRNAFENAFAQIDVQLQRRYELIANVLETASAYMKHESDTLTAVTEARNMALSNVQRPVRIRETVHSWRHYPQQNTTYQALWGDGMSSWKVILT